MSDIFYIGVNYERYISFFSSGMIKKKLDAIEVQENSFKLFLNLI